jgi:hypothetical protein
VTAPIRDDVEKVLKRIEPELYEIVKGAWQDWLESSEVGRTRFTRTRANLVWDRMVDRAFEKFSQDPNIAYIIQFHTVKFIVGNHVLFRFKKGDLKGLSHNFQTQLALAFHDHNTLLFGDFARVEVVYVLNELETQIKRVCVVARNNDTVLWVYDIMPQNAVIEDFPMAPIQRTSPEELVQVRDEEKVVKKKKMSK